MTYSIVARDPETGEMGVAVQSAGFAVGHFVPWVNAGVGVVATQALVEPAYGPKGLTLMRTGVSAIDSLAALRKLDDDGLERQVAMIDAKGRVGVFTGPACIPYCGHAVGTQVACQGNMLRNDGVWDRMLDAYNGARGDLAARMLAALDAAERMGGDMRGSQSAALLVVSGTGKRDLFEDRIFDVRVDDHEAPVAELGRIIDVQRAERALDRGADLLEEGRPDEALDVLERAVRYAPLDPNVVVMAAAGFLMAGNTGRAAEIAMGARRARNVEWVRLAQSLVDVEAFPSLDARLTELFRSALADAA